MSPNERRPRPSARAAREFLREVNYPHRIHPALVPGVSVENQRIRYGVDRGIVGVRGGRRGGRSSGGGRTTR